MDPVEQLLVEFYNVDPQKAKYMARDIASKQAVGDIGMSGGISRDSMYSAVRDSAADPSRVALPMNYQDQLPAFADGAARPYQRQLDQSLMNARGAMQETTNMAINGGRTPSQVMQQPYRAQAAGQIVQGAFGQPDRGGSFDAAGNARMQQTPQRTIRPPMPAGNVQPGGPDFNDKYVRYRNMMVQQDPQNGQSNFDMKLEQRRQLLMQELQAIEQHRNGKSAAMAGAAGAMKASDELRKQSNYLSSPLYGVSSREAYDQATDSDKDGD